MTIKRRVTKLLVGVLTIGCLCVDTVSIPSLADTTEAVTASISERLLLEDLQCSPVDIEFSPDVTTYRVVVPEDTEKILVSAQLADPSSIYRVIGNNNLQPGSNTVTVEVEDLEGNTNVYEIQVIVGEVTDTTALDTTETEETISSSDGQEVPSMAVISGAAETTVSPTTAASSGDSSFWDTVKLFLDDSSHFTWMIGGIGGLVVLLAVVCIVLSLRKTKGGTKKKSASPEDFGSADTSPVSSVEQEKNNMQEEDLSNLFEDLQTTLSKEELKSETIQDGEDSAKSGQETAKTEETNTEDDGDPFEIVDIDKL